LPEGKGTKMRWLGRLSRLARIVFMKDRVEAEMNDEMRLHIELETQENVRTGMGPEEARRAGTAAIVPAQVATIRLALRTGAQIPGGVIQDSLIVDIHPRN